MKKVERDLPEKDNEKQKHHDAFVRWQMASMNQFSYINYIVLTLSLAVLGFGTSLRFEESFKEIVYCLCLFKISLGLMATSMIVGIICAILRSEDFRKTAKIARLKCTDGNENKIEKLSDCTKCLGKWSRGIFWVQSGLFLLGSVLLMLTIGLY